MAKSEEQELDEAVMQFFRRSNITHSRGAGSGIMPVTQLGSDALLPIVPIKRGNRVNLEVRFCAQEDCTTKLSRYNLGKFCGVHE